METSIYRGDLAKRWYKMTDKKLDYLDDEGFLRGGRITHQDAEYIYFV